MKDVWKKSYEYMKGLGMESVSGTGSTLDSTVNIRVELPKLLNQFNVRTMLDIPCGDFNWIGYAIPLHVDYIGMDIVEENVNSNNLKMKAVDNVNFEVGDITESDLPKVDLIFCRDCLVHFSTDDIWKALYNIVRSESSYLLTTTFIDRTQNHDIPTGGWQTLNLCAEPFHFPPPINQIDEKCPEQGGIYYDKILALWKIDALRDAL